MDTPFPRYTALPKPETLIRDLTPWEFQVLVSDKAPSPVDSSPVTRFQRDRVRALNSQDLTPAQIATRLGLIPAQVRAILRRGTIHGRY